MRLGEDKTLRHVPPEAEGLNAVRIVTVHGSKGLEFDAVHFLQVTTRVYEPKGKDQWPLLPKEIFGNNASDKENLLRTERHNLLYVALSRARKQMIVYKRNNANLPVALNGLLAEIDCNSLLIRADNVSAPRVQSIETVNSSIELLEFGNYFKLVMCGSH